jgi:hypothetical protein
MRWLGWLKGFWVQKRVWRITLKAYPIYTKEFRII